MGSEMCIRDRSGKVGLTNEERAHRLQLLENYHSNQLNEYRKENEALRNQLRMAKGEEGEVKVSVNRREIDEECWDAIKALRGTKGDEEIEKILMLEKGSIRRYENEEAKKGG